MKDTSTTPITINPEGIRPLESSSAWCGQWSDAIPPQRRNPQIKRMTTASFGNGQRPRPRASVSSSKAKSGDPIQLPDLELNR